MAKNDHLNLKILIFFVSIPHVLRFDFLINIKFRILQILNFHPCILGGCHSGHFGILEQGSFRQVCVKFKDFSRTSKRLSYCFQGLTDLHIKILFLK